ncbi:YkgJ family cysteine cluster protein [Campylobacter ureolyticus]|uniref:YkgJ family cysteine cluster protein n=1 Tax=Campylobacter ureolyticus TaxID=827 RepID=A0A9Q4PT29_9BACT|nr:YkgJ family cysteine cluster protein [Campylobacter ureolyticus]MCZ6159384.1 YkgJ family cysteine cluster protein [Campylobacter ureolyticus]MCZ6162624.1 YkgJ family cysteine cluster protein [Campylobacter ureolyticus]MCZ6164883.1 YkgJ family cysteine cluster protein [Campylobacter ureolyticus]MCZ6166682.1 YkgJ family cysteine cluster protein [Campylobacter ureolyticus]
MFECDKCGLCCRHIKGIKELEDFMLDDESCINLDKTLNLCKIYDKRPDICRVDEMFKKVFYKFMSKEEYLNLSVLSCEKLKEIYNKG